MITGIGNDIIEIKRIDGAIQRYGQRFLDRIFTKAEQEYCLRHRESARHFAGRFAAKEAIVKALGTGFTRGISWLDIEILGDASGKPNATFSDTVTDMFPCLEVLVSISHCREYAAAVAIRE